jgi:hypothetical protein
MLGIRGEDTMEVVEAPRYPRWFSGENVEAALFIAGGITDCPPWQAELIGALGDIDMVILNPRREKWPRNGDEAEIVRQIKWEFQMLQQASAISFWFPKETVCPITLYELGRAAAVNKTLFVGAHPEYPRRLDVETQLSLIRPHVVVVYSLADLAKEIRGEFA